MTTGPFLMGDNLQLLCSAAAADAAGGAYYPEKSHILTIRQQPERSRVGSVSEKMLMDEAAKAPLRYLKGHRAAAMAGSMVSPLHTLRDASLMQGAYFVFSDLSVRMEGSFRLRFDLFEMEDTDTLPPAKRAKLSPLTSVTCGMLGGASGPGNPNLLIFQHNQFPADYHRNKENMPMICRPLVSRDDHLLDLSDIAAVALLDSLSGALAAESCASQAFSPGFAPTLSSSSPTTMGGIFSSIAETSQQPISSIGFDSGMAPAPFSMGAPFSSYRLTSLRTPDSIYGNSVFLGAAPRLHPTLRSGGGVNNSIISGNDSGIFSYNSRSDNSAAEPAASQILQLPQRLYNSQTRNSNIGTESYGHSHSRTGMGIAYAQQEHDYHAADSRGGEGWSGETLASINMNLPHAGHPPPSRTDLAGAIV
ncbi:hypothetical protein BX661DRAFT_172018 [Kickxella alabastrina]|uniref:uncharacterized protein n=1 Tax=Kickxella alabastrina TaxID=61397 RepID=UPI00221F0C46|nr:uncharacterized protein BX661DRAFT_172018 [Kickxella alabastrina]KAI7825522.1 hypothetical protein BX661DRAFT_172018 [Kickxella alabastrina]